MSLELNCNVDFSCNTRLTRFAVSFNLRSSVGRAAIRAIYDSIDIKLGRALDLSTNLVPSAQIHRTAHCI
jgi:hypothetical protein